MCIHKWKKFIKANVMIMFIYKQIAYVPEIIKLTWVYLEKSGFGKISVCKYAYKAAFIWSKKTVILWNIILM